MKALWRHLRPFKKQLMLLSLLGVVSAFANGAIPYVTGRFFDALIAISRGESGDKDIPLWVIFLGIWFVVQFIATNIDWVMDRMRRAADTRAHLKIQVDGFTHLFRLPLSFHKNARINEVLEQLSKTGWRVSAILASIVQIAPQFLSILIGITLAASINLLLAGILLLGVVFYVLLLLHILPQAGSIDNKAHKLWTDGWADAAAAVHQIETVKQAVSETYEEKKIVSTLLDKSFTSWYKLERIWSNINFFQRTIVFLTQSAVFIISVFLIKNGTITVGELVAINGYAVMFFGPFVQLGHNWQTFQNGLTAAAQSEKMFLVPEEIYTPERAQKLTEFNGSVSFKNVSFAYGPNQPSVLEDISIDVQSGEIVALVGESGVGKSTFVSLISGYYFPTEGSVLIDGIDTRKQNLTELRGNIAVVPQEVALFNESIKQNIRYGVFDASEENVRAAARSAHIDTFIESLPKKYETLVGERGIKLSVGQKQRLAIARAILRNPKILILDEPTSALDSKTEQFIAGSLEQLMKSRTTFIIAHRLSTVRKANKIFVLHNGRIAEEGTHDHLIQIKDGIYRKLYEYQVGLRP